jgi:hypothetical protein
VSCRGSNQSKVSTPQFQDTDELVEEPLHLSEPTMRAKAGRSQSGFEFGEPSGQPRIVSLDKCRKANRRKRSRRLPRAHEFGNPALLLPPYHQTVTLMGRPSAAEMSGSRYLSSCSGGMMALLGPHLQLGLALNSEV